LQIVLLAKRPGQAELAGLNLNFVPFVCLVVILPTTNQAAQPISFHHEAHEGHEVQDHLQAC